MKADVPDHIRDAWTKIHDELQRRLEAAYAAGATFALIVEINGSNGAPLGKTKWTEHARLQSPTPRRKRADP